MTFDDILRELVGEFGRWQKLLTLLISLYLCCMGILAFDIVFMAGQPPSWCRTAGRPGNVSLEAWLNLTVPWEQWRGGWRRDPCHLCAWNSSQQVDGDGHLLFHLQGDTDNVKAIDCTKVSSLVETCTEYVYDSTTFQSTVVTEWDLVCDSSYLVSITKSVSLAGLMVGSGLGGFFADRFGRQRILVITIPALMLAKLAVCFSPNLTFYNIFNFLSVGVMSMSFIVGFILIMELVGPSRRGVVGSIASEAFSMGYLTLVLLAYLVRSWRILNGIITAIIAPSVGLLFIIPESPRWLLARGNVRAARKVLRNLARLNRHKFPGDIDLTLEKETCGPDRIWHLCASLKMACRSFVIFFAWFTVAIVYYSLTLSAGLLAGDLYLNMTIYACLELLACALSQLIINTCLGRRVTSASCYLLAGLALLFTLAAPHDKPLIVMGLTTFGRFWVCAVFNSIYIWTAELLPTCLRNSGISTYSFLGKIGAVIAPFSQHLAKIHPAMPSAVLGSISILCGLMMLTLPETRGKPLPQTMTDITGYVGRSGERKRLWDSFTRKKYTEGQAVSYIMSTGSYEDVSKEEVLDKIIL